MQIFSSKLPNLFQLFIWVLRLATTKHRNLQRQQQITKETTRV